MQPGTLIRDYLTLGLRFDRIEEGYVDSFTGDPELRRAVADEPAPEPAELVVKDGATGATAFTGGETAFEPSLPVDVVDVVGAGDAFAGGYLAARLSGAALRTRLRAGHERAALTLRTTGDYVPAGSHA